MNYRRYGPRMDRRNGNSRVRCYKRGMPPAVVRYREFRPCAGLRDFVRALFSFTPAGPGGSPSLSVTREILFQLGDPFCSPLIADGHVSIVFSFPRICRADGVWRPGAGRVRADVIGPMTTVGDATLDERPEMVGVYLRVPGAARLTGIPAPELTDMIVALEDLWGPSASALAANLCELDEEMARLAY